MKPPRKIWRQLKISDLIENESLEIGDGYRAKNSEMASAGLPFARAGNINNGFNFEDADLLSEKSVAQVGNKISQPDDSVITTKGTFGRVAYVRPNTPRFVYSPQLCYWRVKNQSVIQSRFVYYWLQGPDFLSQAYQVKSSTDMADYTNLTDQRRMLITAPDVDSQKKIAGILSMYDELIENNQRRIALLENMAEEIYREWFVRMRFPGHENVKFVKRVPQGWQVAELKEVSIEASRNARPGSHLAERLYLPLENLNTRQMIPGGHQSYTEAQSSLATFEKGDILFGAMRPYQHKVAIAPFAGITRTTCFVIRPKMPHAWSWLFLTLFQQTSVDYATMICNGADRPYVVWNKGMERMKLLRPDDALLTKFEEVARPILASISSMYFVQLKLKECRDILLPRLISGKLSVENLDIQFPPGMAEVQLQVA